MNLLQSFGRWSSVVFIFLSVFEIVILTADTSFLDKVSGSKILFQQDQAPQRKPQCVMYGVCDESLATPDTNLTCKYDGPPIKFPDDSLADLKAICPELVEQHGDELCCSADQVGILAMNLGMPQALIARCPSCFYNFRQILCELTCGPWQASFMNVTKSINSTLYPGKKAVTELHVYVDDRYIQGTYESCKSVMVSATNQPAMDILCGPWGAYRCNAHRWFDYMGSTSNGFSPFDIIYEYTFSNYTGTFTPYSPDEIFKCSDRINNNTSPCGCVDCEEACPAPQPFPPLIPREWILFGLDGTSVLMVVLCTLGNIIIAFFVIMHDDNDKDSAPPATEVIPDDHPRNPNLNNHHNNLHEQQHHHDQRLLPDGEIMAMYPLASMSLFQSAQQGIKKMFGVLGRTSAGHPYFTLLVLLIPLALSTALFTSYFKITTDPVELWANPHSRTRIEKKFFDKNFGPFFRTEQIIISSSDPPFQRNNSDGVLQTFGPVFRKSFLIELSNLQRDIESLNNGSLKNICLKPLETSCTIFSLMEYWQNSVENLNVTMDNGTSTYLDHFLFCSKNPTSLKDSTSLHQSCLGEYGGPVDPKLVLGGIPSDTDADPVMLANTTVLTFVVRNHIEDVDNAEAKLWESAFISYMESWSAKNEQRLNISVAFSSERSVQDELSRESRAEISTILISYIIMFIYIALSLGFGKYFVRLINSCSWRRYFWWEQINRRTSLVGVEEVSATAISPVAGHSQTKWYPRLILSLVGVLLVFLSVIASIGLFSFAGVPATLIVMEVVPFLVLAVGVDNIFIIVQTYDRTFSRESLLSVPERIGYVMTEIGPSLLISVISESVCFFIGGLVAKMPAVETFAYYSAVALIMDFVLQISVFTAVFGLCEEMEKSRKVEDDTQIIINNDSQIPSTSSSPPSSPTRRSASRSSSRRVSGNNKHRREGEVGVIETVFTKCYAPFILGSKWMRMGILMTFYTWLCVSIALIHKVDVGLDQRLSMPSDSYVLKYFNFLAEYLEVGPPAYFVVASNASSPSLTDASVQAKLSASGSSFSLVSQIFSASKIANESYIAKPASSWIDDFIDWAANGDCCKQNSTTGEFCLNSDTHCDPCNIDVEDMKINPDDFRHYISFFLQDIPTETCPKAGHAAYSNAVSLGTVNNKTEVVASYFMTYHTVLKTSHDYVNALKQAQFLSDNITQALDNEFLVFPYSVFYVFYEQYLDTWHQILLNLGLGLAGVALVILVGTFSFTETILVFLTILFIIIDLIGMMYIFRISLNALSLVNLVMAVGISVEFCVHLVRAFARSTEDTHLNSLEKSKSVLGSVGSSVFSGITLTKIAGIIVLGFAKTKIFEVFYFRLYLLIVLIGAAHGLCLLPVLLSFIKIGDKK